MYTKTENPVALRSQQELAEALLALMKQHPFQEITVTQICQEALIARKTFYRNFQSKEDILYFLLDRLLVELCSQVELASISFQEELLQCFAFFYGQKELLILLQANNLLHLFSESTTRYIRDTACYEQVSAFTDSRPEQEIYFTNFIAAAVSATVELWIVRGFDLPVEEIAHLTCKLLNRINPEE